MRLRSSGTHGRRMSCGQMDEGGREGRMEGRKAGPRVGGKKGEQTNRDWKPPLPSLLAAPAP